MTDSTQSDPIKLTERDQVVLRQSDTIVELDAELRARIDELESHLAITDAHVAMLYDRIAQLKRSKAK